MSTNEAESLKPPQPTQEDAAISFDVFIGWSNRGGDAISKSAAELLQTMIQNSLPQARVFTSSSSLPTGKTWFPDLCRAGRSARWGIFCISDLNYLARWPAFEAGLVAGNLTLEQATDGGRIVVFLVGGGTSEALSKSPFDPYQNKVSAKDNDQVSTLLYRMYDALGQPGQATEFNGRASKAIKVFFDDYRNLVEKSNELRAKTVASIVDLDPKIQSVWAAINHLATVVGSALPDSPPALDNRHVAPASRISQDLSAIIFELLRMDIWGDKPGILQEVPKVTAQLVNYIESPAACSARWKQAEALQAGDGDTASQSSPLTQADIYESMLPPKYSLEQIKANLSKIEEEFCRQDERLPNEEGSEVDDEN